MAPLRGILGRDDGQPVHRRRPHRPVGYSGTLSNASVPLHIGSLSSAIPGEFFPGDGDEVRVWNVG